MIFANEVIASGTNLLTALYHSGLSSKYLVSDFSLTFTTLSISLAFLSGSVMGGY